MLCYRNMASRNSQRSQLQYHSNDQTGGAVVCYVNNDWPSERLRSLEQDDLETLWLLLREPAVPHHVYPIVVGVVYRPPGANGRPMTDRITECIDNITQLHPYAGVMVHGDFNLLKNDSLRSYPLTQLVHHPTCTQASRMG